MNALAQKIRPSIQSLNLEGVTLERRPGIRILDQVTFSFPKTTVIQVIGRTGAGVSSLLQMLAGILPPSEGRYLLDTVDTAGTSPAEFLPYQKSIGYGFDEGGLIANLTLLENLRLPLSYHGDLSHQAAERLAIEYLDRFGISSHQSEWPAMASQGTRKACGLARSLVMAPQVLILDEPTLGLDRAAVDRLVTNIKYHLTERGLKQVILGTHDEYFLSFFEYATVEISNGQLGMGREK